MLGKIYQYTDLGTIMLYLWKINPRMPVWGNHLNTPAIPTNDNNLYAEQDIKNDFH